MDKRLERLNWIGDNPIELEPNEKLALLTKGIRTLIVSGQVKTIPKGSLVIHRYKDNSIKVNIKVRYNEGGRYGIWIYVNVKPHEVMDLEWEKVK